jgi:membrane protein DedA with SNARE-associated domain
VPEFLESFLRIVAAQPYLSLFVGMLIAGELVLLPAIFLAVTGQLEFVQVIIVAIAATLLKDFGLYYLGRRFPAAALRRLPGKGTSALVQGLDRLFRERGPQLLFASKFVYGTRAVVQVLAGVHDMPLRPYLIANSLGTAALTLALSGIAWSVADTAQRYADAVRSVELAFLVFVVTAVLGQLSVAMVARRRWSR